MAAYYIFEGVLKRVEVQLIICKGQIDTVPSFGSTRRSHLRTQVSRLVWRMRL